MLELEEKIGFAKRYRAMQDGLARLDHLTREIRFCNANRYDMSEEIQNSCNEMLDIVKSITDNQ